MAGAIGDLAAFAGRDDDAAAVVAASFLKDFEGIVMELDEGRVGEDAAGGWGGGCG